MTSGFISLLVLLSPYDVSCWWVINQRHDLPSGNENIRSPELKACGELIGWDSSRLPCVPFTLSNLNISETSRPIEIKFHLKHQWGWGKAALDFGPDQIRTLVSRATGSSHRVIMGKFL